MSNRVKARFFKEQYFVLCPLGFKNICSVQVRLGGVLHVVFCIKGLTVYCVQIVLYIIGLTVSCVHVAFVFNRVNCLLCTGCFVYNRVNCLLCTACQCCTAVATSPPNWSDAARITTGRYLYSHRVGTSTLTG